MAETLGSTSARIVEWLRGSPSTSGMRNDAINDAIESLFQTLIRVQLEVFMQGPVNLTLEAASEGVNLVSIADPTVGPVISAAAADVATLAAHSIQAAYTFVTESGSETLMSPATDYTTTDGFLAAVHPPTIVSGAFGWNCYARAIAAGQLVLQNDAPLPFLTTSASYFDEPETGFTNDPDDPLPPIENTTGDNLFYIRHMEVVTGSGIRRSWNQADIDSDFMRRMGMVIPSTSDYQNYAFDLINQRQLEIRPALGVALTARYFFVVKPRRLMFANAPLPFPTVASAEFIRNYALSQLFAALREWKASEVWGNKAEESRQRCELALTTTNRPKNQRITPFRT